MSRGLRAAGRRLADRPVDIARSAPKLLCRGFRDYQRFEFTIAGEDPPLRQSRDVLRFGQVAAVLPFDVHCQVAPATAPSTIAMGMTMKTRNNVVSRFSGRSG